MKAIVLILLVLAASPTGFAQKTEEDRKRNQPVEPFRIIGNIYYVGVSEITSFLIATPKGHILLDGGFAMTAPQIKANIEKLGFKLKDVKFLLNSQAHYDHAGGLAELKRLTGAKLLASEADKILLENGGKGDFSLGDWGDYEPVKVDKTIKDGEKISLGGTTIKALITPGHTKGCTTWTLETEENNREYKVVFVGSTTSPGYKLKGNEKYPNIVADFEKTFRVLKQLKPDIFLASHGSFFNLLDKTLELKNGKSPNPFIDLDGYRKFIENAEKEFYEKLAKE
ncbi:MAG: subclass B3 metallo-beta-lactamase [Acidobacteriota bacterium]|nr:subclass B3 metallo-beta-lactamase [Acidobacteriota bacterium]